MSSATTDFGVLLNLAYNSFVTALWKNLAAAGMIVLLAILLVLNAVAIWLRNKYEKKW